MLLFILSLFEGSNQNFPTTLIVFGWKSKFDAGPRLLGMEPATCAFLPRASSRNGETSLAPKFRKILVYCKIGADY
jgi:hypothetical protein